jgi:hypothetical protein
MAPITGTGTMIPGDIFTVSGDSQTYVVTGTGITAASQTLTFYPGAAVAWAGSTAITVKGAGSTYVNNFGMDRGFMALGMRQPRTEEKMLNEVTPMIDNQGPEATGMQFFLNVTPNSWGVTYGIGAFWGVTMLRPERGVRMLG